ncbi:hypothetical protein J3F83DRAFT_752150 [Trichoderma novae-zelandiae]
MNQVQLLHVCMRVMAPVSKNTGTLRSVPTVRYLTAVGTWWMRWLSCACAGRRTRSRVSLALPRLSCLALPCLAFSLLCCGAALPWAARWRAKRNQAKPAAANEAQGRDSAGTGTGTRPVRSTTSPSTCTHGGQGWAPAGVAVDAWVDEYSPVPVAGSVVVELDHDKRATRHSDQSVLERIECAMHVLDVWSVGQHSHQTQDIWHMVPV